MGPPPPAWWTERPNVLHNDTCATELDYYYVYYSQIYCSINRAI